MDLTDYSFTVSTNYIPTLARRLRRYGITQWALAKAMGRSPSQVNRWLRGKVVPDLASLSRIEAALRTLRGAK